MALSPLTGFHRAEQALLNDDLRVCVLSDNDDAVVIVLYLLLTLSEVPPGMSQGYYCACKRAYIIIKVKGI